MKTALIENMYHVSIEFYYKSTGALSRMPFSNWLRSAAVFACLKNACCFSLSDFEISVKRN